MSALFSLGNLDRDNSYLHGGCSEPTRVSALEIPRFQEGSKFLYVPAKEQKSHFILHGDTAHMS